MKLAITGLLLVAATQSKESLFSARLYPHSCLWQCDKLFNGNLVLKDCSTLSRQGDSNLTTCACNHILTRPSWPRCVISICGDLEEDVFETYLQDHLIFPNQHPVHASVGLWAACVQSPEEIVFLNEGQFWKPTSTDEALAATLFTRAADHRMPRYRWMRRLLIPIWRSESFETRLYYRAPPDAAKVEHPRSSSDLLNYLIFTVYFFAAVAYAHLLHTTSKSERYIHEFLQFVAFMLLPGLPVVQLVNKLVQVVFRTAGPGNFRYHASGVCGEYVFERRDTSTYKERLVDLSIHELEQRNGSYCSCQFLGRLVAILINLGLVAARVAAYIRRLRTMLPGPGHHDFYIAATGLDHRLGWVAIGGMASTLVTLLRHLLNVEWSIDPNLHMPRRSNFDWKLEVWLEIMAAAVAQNMLLKLTNRITAHTFLNRFWRTLDGKYLFTALAFISAYCLQYRHALWNRLQSRSTGLRKTLKIACMVFTAVYIALVAFVQVFADVEELADLRLGWTFEWNYLWKAPDPSWLML